jgi:Family of unknown function (DUF6459)
MTAAKTAPALPAAHRSPRPLEPDPTTAVRCSVRAAPVREPSFEDEPRPRHLYLIQTAAMPQLPFPLPRTAPASTPDPTPWRASEPIRRLSVVPDLAAPVVATGPALSPVLPQDRPAPKPLAPLPASAYRPDPSRFSRQFAQGLLEVLSGHRPMVQLSRHVSPAVQRGLTRAGGHHPLESPNKPTLHSLHVSEPAAGVCEMSAIVVVGVRYRAMAARLEWRIDHWRCTALQIG